MTVDGHRQRMPKETYYEPAWSERERRELFGRSWFFGEYQKPGANQAASCSSLPASSRVFSPGYHCSNFFLSVPSRARVQACSMRCAPQFLVPSFSLRAMTQL